MAGSHTSGPSSAVIAPASQGSSGLPAVAPVALPPRRRLAVNVVCLWPDDRPVVVQPSRRGRYPQCVTRINSRPRLMVGDLAELFGSLVPENDGHLVKIIAFDRGDSDSVRIQAVFNMLQTVEISTGERSGFCKETWTAPSRLRRVSNLRLFRAKGLQ